MRRVIYLLLGMCIFTHVSAEDIYYDYAANFLAEKGIISKSDDYDLDSNITRREMLKVMMNLSGKEISKDCTGKFQDFSSSDWGCKYAEAALKHGYIAANKNFKPDDFVTNIEALKMVMQARGMPKIEQYTLNCFSGNCPIEKWEDQYIVGSLDYKLRNKGGENQPSQIVFDKSGLSKRSDVFKMAARTFDEYKNSTKYWREYSTPYFSVKYPEYFQANFENGKYLFGDTETFLHHHFSIEEASMSIDAYIKKKLPGLEETKYKKTTIQTDDGMLGTRVLMGNGVDEFIRFQDGDRVYNLYSGINTGIYSGYFEKFYKSFQVK